MIVITFDDIMTIIILAIIILLFIVNIISISIKDWINRKFKKNCYKCKHYEYYGTNLGQDCNYKCYKHNRIDLVNVNSWEHFEKCDDFEEKEVEKDD